MKQPVLYLLSPALMLPFIQGCNQSDVKDVKSPPNIVWITCEDMSPRLSTYGDSLAPTPNIDKLAEEF